MPRITLAIKYTIDLSSVMSIQDLKTNFLSGLPLQSSGVQISDETYAFYLKSAQELIESQLGIKLAQQVITETKDYISDDYIQWGFIKATYPVMCAVGLTGILGTKKQVFYPKDWLSVRRTNDGRTYSREFRLVPNTGSITYENTAALYLGGVGAYPFLGWWRGNRQIPNYWTMEYVTGFPNNQVPSDILQAVGIVAAMPILGILSDHILGNRALGWGVASKSISLDGLSQSVSSYANGQTGIFGARMKQYSDSLFGVSGKPGLLDILKDAYSAIVWGVC